MFKLIKYLLNSDNWYFARRDKLKGLKNIPITSTGTLTSSLPFTKIIKRRMHSIGFHDSTIRITWIDQKEPDLYHMTPFRHDDFIDSTEFYFIGRYLQEKPEGFQVQFNKELFKITPIK